MLQLHNAMAAALQLQPDGLVLPQETLFADATTHSPQPNPPCNTLFVGNLGAYVNGDELRVLFMSQPGFR